MPSNSKQRPRSGSADEYTIRVLDAFDGSPMLSGTTDGNRLAKHLLAAMASHEGDVRVDFDGIEGVSYSAACAFWQVVTGEHTNIAHHIVFSNIIGNVLDAIRHGYECAEDSEAP